MTNFYTKKDSLFVANEILQDTDLSITAIGIYLVMASNSEKYYSVEELCKHENDNALEVKEALSQLVEKKVITQKGWMYIVNKANVN